MLLKDYKEKVKQSMHNIYGFTYDEKEKRVLAPERDVPACVTDRIIYFSSFSEDGMTFYGAYSSVLALDEQESKKEFEYGSGAEWMEVTEEFRKWCDETPLYQLVIASIMLY